MYLLVTFTYKYKTITWSLYYTNHHQTTTVPVKENRESATHRFIGVRAFFSKSELATGAPPELL